MDQQAQQIHDEEQRKIFYESQQDVYDEFQQYQDILLNSFFSTSFALFERQLAIICNFAKEVTKSKSSAKDLGSRDYLNNVKIYLKKRGVQFPGNTPEWNKVRIYQGIRNKIMHAGGYVHYDWKYSNDAKSMGIISGGGFERLKLTRPICEEAVNNFEKFLIMVHKAVGDLKV